MLRRLIPLFVFFAGCAVAAVSARAADVEFLHVWPAWREAESFERIGEYFGGRENTGREVVLRSQPGARAGYYFLVRVKNATAQPAAKFELSVIRPDTPEPKVYPFPTALPAKEAVFQLGLTGADWPAGKAGNPVAWKLVLLAADGRVLAEHKSFLWEKPAK
jgi:hypothetical protein